MSSKSLYATAVIIIGLVAGASVLSNMKADTSEVDYQNAVSQGKELESRKLYGRAVNAYSAAGNIYDSIGLRLKIADIYGRGYEDGEFGSLEYKENVLRGVINDYLEDERVIEAYDGLIEIFINQGDYKRLVNLVKHARSNGKNSDKLTEAYELIRYKYDISQMDFDMLESVGPFWIGRKAVDVDEESGEKPINEFVFLYEDGSESEHYYRIEMSAPTDIQIDGTSYKYYFTKNYGNDIGKLEQSVDVYSSINRDGLRRTYIKGDRESWYQFGSGMISLLDKNTGKWDIFDYEGEIKGGGYDTAGTFGNGYMYVEKDGKSRIINSNFIDVFGEDVKAITGFGGRCSINSRMFMRKASEDKYTLYDMSGETPVSMGITCDDADLFIESVAAFKRGDKWGFMDLAGNVVIEPKYDRAKSFRNGYAAVMKDGVWGFINGNDEMIIEPQFEDAYYFRKDGTVFVMDNGTYGKLALFYMEASNNGENQK